jgi:hypothetical protein
MDYRHCLGYWAVRVHFVGEETRMNVLRWLAKLVDPRGPVGEIVSPSEVFKSRAGLPIESPHTLRADQSIYDPAAIRYSLRPTQFVALGTQEPPKYLQRQVSRYVEEVWTPAYATTKSENIADIIRAGQTLVGYRVSERAVSPQCDCENAKFTVIDGELAHGKCGRPMAYIGAEHSEDIAEHVRSLNIAQADDNYNDFYPTIRGTDSVMTPAGPAKGGTRITRGRAQYRERTAGMVHVDGSAENYVFQRNLAEGQERKRLKDQVPVHAEQFVKRFFPRIGKKQSA